MGAVEQSHSNPFSQRITQDETEGWCEDCEDTSQGSPVSVRNWADHHARKRGHTAKTMRTIVRTYQ